MNLEQRAEAHTAFQKNLASTRVMGDEIKFPDPVVTSRFLPKIDRANEQESTFIPVDELPASTDPRALENALIRREETGKSEAKKTLKVELNKIPEQSRNAALNFLLALTDNTNDQSINYYVGEKGMMSDRLEITNKHGKTFNIPLVNFTAVLGLKDNANPEENTYIPRPYDSEYGVNIDRAHEFRELVNSFTIWNREPKLNKVVVRVPRAMDIHK